NDGAGLQAAQRATLPAPRSFGNNVIRYNLSVNDGRKNAYGGLHLSGDATLSGVVAYNNTVVMPAGSINPALRMRATTGDLKIFNNVFVGAGTSAPIADVVFTGSAAKLLGNLYWS